MSKWLLDSKCVERMGWLFSDLDTEERAKVQMNEVAFYSVTPAIFSIKISDLMRKVVEKLGQPPYVAIDGTACVGGDTRQFAERFDMTIAIEKEEATCELLKKNVENWGLDVQVHHGDVTDMLADLWKLTGLKAGSFALYLDPPWGGIDYRSEVDIQLTLGPLAVEDVVNRAFEMHKSLKVAVIKLPKNYNRGYLFRKLKKHEVYVFAEGNFYVIFVGKTGTGIKMLCSKLIRDKASARKDAREKAPEPERQKQE